MNSISEVCQNCKRGFQYGGPCSSWFHKCKACVWDEGKRVTVCDNCAATEGGISISEVCPTCGHGFQYGRFCSNGFHCCKACVWDAGRRIVVCEDCAAEEGGTNPYVLKLAAHIIAYEMNEPHTGKLGFDLETGHYPKIAIAQVETWLAEEHHKDCGKPNIICNKCRVIRAHHYAQFILYRWKKRDVIVAPATS